MSSHHFVRDGQEPALAILEPIDYSISDLLEWAPLVIITDTVIDLASMWGIKIDIVITDPDTLASTTEKLNHQHPLEIITTEPNESQVFGVTRYLLSHRIQAINICFNQVPEDLKIFEALAEQLDLSVFDRNAKWSMIPSGDFQKWLKKDSVLTFRTAGEVVYGGNVKMIGDDRVITLEDGLIRLESEKLLWIGQARE